MSDLNTQQLSTSPAANTSGSKQADINQLIARLPAVVYICTPEIVRQCSYLSASSLRLFGEHAAQISKSLNAIIHELDRSKTEAKIRFALEQKQSYEIHYRALNGNGQTIWVTDIGTPFFDEAGQLLYQGFILDSTEQIESERQLEQIIAHNTQEMQDTNHKLECALQQQKKHEKEQLSNLIRIQKLHSSAFEIATCDSIAQGNIDDTCAQVASKMSHSLDVARSSCWFYLEDQQCFELKAAHGNNKFDVGSVLIPDNVDTIIHTLQMELCIDIEHCPSDKRSQLFRQFLNQESIAWLLMPIRRDDNLVGFLLMECDNTRSWPVDEAMFASTMCDQIKVAILNHQHIEAQRQLNQLAYFDTLTGLQNRQLFHQNLKQSIKIANRQHIICALVYLDLDNFKQVNDTLGHDAGDELLTTVAQRLHTHTRSTDHAARIGGDEFNLLMIDVKSAENVAIAVDKLMTELRKPMDLHGRQYQLSCSIGITLLPEDTNDQQEALKFADLAMYRAKALGKNNYQFFREEMNANALKRMDTERQVKRAIDQDEFELWYQPIVDLSDNKLVGLEALVRWLHPLDGIIEPSQFFPTLEQSDLILQFGQWAFQKACDDVNRLQSECGALLPISLNLTEREFSEIAQLQHYAQMYQQQSCDKHAIKLEVKEYTVSSNFEQSLQHMRLLVEAGIDVVVDHFGEKSGSALHLSQMPISMLKLNANKITEQAESQLSELIQLMASHMNIKIVALGIETDEQLNLIRQQEYKLAQGFSLYHPMPLKSIKALLELDQQIANSE